MKHTDESLYEDIKEYATNLQMRLVRARSNLEVVRKDLKNTPRWRVLKKSKLLGVIHDGEHIVKRLDRKYRAVYAVMRFMRNVQKDRNEQNTKGS